MNTDSLAREELRGIPPDGPKGPHKTDNYRRNLEGMAISSMLWRLVTMGALILAFALLPPPDKALPPWAVMLACLGASRIPALYELLAGAGDLEMSLPYIPLALLALARFSSGNLPALGAETAAAALLLSRASALMAALGKGGRSGLALASLAVLVAMAFAWSLDSPLSVAGGEVSLALLFATAERGRPGR